MTRPSSRLVVTTIVFALACLGVPELRNAADGAPPAAKKDITLTLKISDRASGFTLEAKKFVAADSSAFDVLRHTVAVTYKTDVDGGPIVTPVIHGVREAVIVPTRPMWMAGRL